MKIDYAYYKNAAINGLSGFAMAEKECAPDKEVSKKENTNMKHFIAGLTVLAAAGAVLGAAGYYVYKKSQNNNADYEELIFTDDMDGEFGEVEDAEPTAKEKVAQAAEDVKGIVANAAENVAHTVSDAFFEVKDAIDSAIEE